MHVGSAHNDSSAVVGMSLMVVGGLGVGVSLILGLC